MAPAQRVPLRNCLPRATSPSKASSKCVRISHRCPRRTTTRGHRWKINTTATTTSSNNSSSNSSSNFTIINSSCRTGSLPSCQRRRPTTAHRSGCHERRCCCGAPARY
uniref:(northern house mosquito) hypothetical protein n=1 Tax=Culex pipiens TaxID=7175 RepID=A0A8D8GR68_CULPI